MVYFATKSNNWYMPWSDFIKKLESEFRLSDADIETRTGVRRTNIYKLRNGLTESPNQFTIKKIEEGLNIKINDTDPENINYTRLEMTQDRFGKLLHDASQFKDSLLVREFPLLSMVYAGEPAMLEHEYYDEKAVFAYDKPGHSCFALRVSGKSMETTLRDGDIILVDISIPIIDGCLVVVKLRDGSQIIKRYHNLDEVYIKLTSDNHEYGVKLVKKEDIQVCYRVVSINFFL